MPRTSALSLPVRGFLQEDLEGVNAFLGKGQLLCFWIDGGSGDQGLPFKVVERGAVGIEGNGLFCGGIFRIALSGLEEHNGLVGAILSCFGGKRRHGLIKRSLRLRNLAFVRVDLSKACVYRPQNLWWAALAVVDEGGNLCGS